MTLRVACAILQDQGKVLAAQRGVGMSMPLKWEFPGGKLETGESAEQCLVREISEELGISIRILTPLPVRTHDYGTFNITLYPFICIQEQGEIHLREHQAVVWTEPGRLFELDWAEADLAVINDYLELVRKACSSE